MYCIYKIIILGPRDLMVYLITNANNVKEVIKIHPMSIKNDVGQNACMVCFVWILILMSLSD